ncbi:MAG: dicarboxylate/amino acid:cation symporter [Bacteroidetes bacterium]|nr:dicarboxylate/amino acid:cation symporter [Bacteroidota bacterium]
MTKSNKLTAFILVAMALGILIGGILNKKATGKELVYTPLADSLGRDFISLVYDDKSFTQDVFIVKDDKEKKIMADSLGKSVAIVVKGKSAVFIPACIQTGKVTDLNCEIEPSGKGVVEKNLIKKIAANVSVLTTIFLLLIKMIIAPLVLSTLIVGIAKMGDTKTLGRVGGKTMLWFITASLVSLVLGMVLVNAFEPGAHMNLTLPAENAKTGVEGTAITFVSFITHVFPSSIFKAMAENEILQIVVFSIFFGVAAAAIGEKAMPLVKALDTLSHIMIKITIYVMGFAPYAVFAAMCAVITTKGLSVLSTYAIFMGEFYFGLFILWVILISAGFAVLRKRVFTLLRRIKEPFLLAFSTASSEAAFPKLITELERFGCNNKIVSFTLPLGYSFNLDGSMMYMTFASIFIAQCYGIDLTITQEITMLLTLMITSKGIAAVPRASLVVIAGTISMFNIPQAGLVLLLGIDTFLDMGRSATNVIGNAIATAAVSKWEGALED